MHPRRDLSPYLLLLLPPLFWAGNAVIGRAVVGTLPPLAFSFWRWVLAFAVILPFALPRLVRQWPAIRHQWPALLALGLTSVTAYNTLLYLALQSSTAVSVTLIAAAMPATIMVLAVFWLGEKLGPWQWLGMLVSLLGVLLVLSHGSPSRLLHLGLHGGDLWAVAANLSWAVYSVMLRRSRTGLDTLSLLTVQIAVGLPFILPFYLWELASGRVLILDAGSIGAIVYAGLFASLVAYFAWNRGVAAVGPVIAGQYTYLIPVFTALIAAVALGEHVELYHGLALLLIVSGLSLASLRLS